MNTASTLRESTQAFCHALISPPEPAALLSTHFRAAARITEHGPAWSRARLPFVGRTFSGYDECVEYFALMAGVLDMALAEDAFDDGAFIVDAGVGMVSVVGKGRLTSRKTGKGWDETFVFRFSGFDGEGRIGHWEIWADPLSAWEAVGE